MEFNHVANDLIDCAYVVKPQIKSPGDEARQASRLVNISALEMWHPNSTRKGAVSPTTALTPRLYRTAVPEIQPL